MHKLFLSGNTGRKSNTVAASRKGHSVAGGQVGGRITVPSTHAVLFVCAQHMSIIYFKKKKERRIRKRRRRK